MASKETVATPPPKHPAGVDRFGRRLRPVRRDRRQGRAHVGAYDRGSPHWRAWCARPVTPGFQRGGWRGRRATPSGLEPGWLFGRANDLSDTQWRGFRGQLPSSRSPRSSPPPRWRSRAPPQRARHARSTPCTAPRSSPTSRRSRALDRRPDPRPSPRVPPLPGAPFLGPAVAWTSALVALVASQFWARAQLDLRAVAQSPLLSHRSSHSTTRTPAYSHAGGRASTSSSSGW